MAHEVMSHDKLCVFKSVYVYILENLCGTAAVCRPPKTTEWSADLNPSSQSHQRMHMCDVVSERTKDIFLLYEIYIKKHAWDFA